MICRKWLRRCRNETGGYLIEASMTMPLLFLATIMMLGIGYAVYLKAEAVQKTYEWTERAAYVWKDSHKESVTGAFSYHEMDDIYGSLLQEGFGFLTSSFNGFRQSGIRLPSLEADGPQVQRSKLLRSSGLAAGQLEGQAAYYNKLLEGELQAEWMRAGTSSSDTFLLVPTAAARVQASSYVSDPVEFLRNVYLVQEYAVKLKNRFTSPRSAAEELGGLAPAAPERTVIRSEAQAKAYVKLLVGGSAAEIETSLGKRQIDVLDSDNVMHDAKYYINKADALEQLKKDAELLRTGKVQGVVWHIFLLQKENKFDLTESLRKKLEANGIMVVLHR